MSETTDDLDWFDGEEELFVEVRARLVAETKKAYLLNTGEGKPQAWVPKSLVYSLEEHGEEVKIGWEGGWEMPLWLAKEKRFDHEQP